MNEHAKLTPQATGSMKQFEILVGEWTTVETHPQLPSAVHGYSSFSWLKEDGLLLWRFDSEPGGGIPTALSVIGCDDSTGACSVLYSDERGVTRIYQMSLEDGIWKMWRDAPGFLQRMTATISSDGNTITSHGELSRDGKHWEQDLNVTYTRKQ